MMLLLLLAVIFAAAAAYGGGSCSRQQERQLVRLWRCAGWSSGAGWRGGTAAGGWARSASARSAGLGGGGGPDAGTGGDLRLLLAAPVRPQHCRACRCLQRDHCVAFVFFSHLLTGCAVGVEAGCGGRARCGGSAAAASPGEDGGRRRRSAGGGCGWGSRLVAGRCRWLRWRRTRTRVRGMVATGGGYSAAPARRRRQGGGGGVAAPAGVGDGQRGGWRWAPGGQPAAGWRPGGGQVAAGRRRPASAGEVLAAAGGSGNGGLVGRHPLQQLATG